MSPELGCYGARNEQTGRSWSHYRRFAIGMVFATEPGAYGFVHLETTGITSHVIVDGSRVAIQFSDSPDAFALAALEALRRHVLLPIGDGRLIVITGEPGQTLRGR